jgi:hypothetical protein
LNFTGKSLSETLIFESTNPQYDERLFIEFPETYKFRTCCVQILFWMSKQKQKNNFCAQHVLNLYFSGEFNEQSLVILWVNWCKNEGFWKRFTCKKLWNVPICTILYRVFVSTCAGVCLAPVFFLGFKYVMLPLDKKIQN